mmetsp:Transcript_127572/g.220603  ORF Transcript_127572/g.220603 Transcript_127572/m.220603 type:complete len:82 (+) Transcript_127572:318-563(+)
MLSLSTQQGWGGLYELHLAESSFGAGNLITCSSFPAFSLCATQYIACSVVLHGYKQQTKFITLPQIGMTQRVLLLLTMFHT